MACTTSGGACVNATALHVAVPTLPFGGVGKSGSGRHHGYEGFLEFSNLCSVVVGAGAVQRALDSNRPAVVQVVIDGAANASEMPGIEEFMSWYGERGY